MAQTDKYYLAVSFIAMPASNYDTNVAAFDSAVGTMHVANAITPPAIPEFPIAVVGLITVLMMGFAIMMTRRMHIGI
jgi:hypothetical protein